MKTYYNVPCDLYVHKDGIQELLQGGSSIGYTELHGCKTDYERIDRHCFQPILAEHKLSDQAYDVVFIMK